MTSRRTPWLLLMPFAVLVYALRMPGFCGTWGVFEADPGYFFLINSLNIVTGHPVWYINQPGTTVQAIGALTIQLVHAVSGSGDVVGDLIRRPDVYVTVFYWVLMLGYVVTLAGLGFAARRYTGSVGAAVVVQSVPFLAGFISAPGIGRDRLVPLSSECLLVSVVALLLIAVLHDITAGRQSPRRAALYGAIVGFGLATKLTTAPLALIPLLLLGGWRGLVSFAAATLGAFVLFTAPIWSEYPTLAHWIGQVVSHQGSGGTGTEGALPIGLWLSRILGLGLGDPVLSVLVLLGGAMLARRALGRAAADTPWTGSDRLLAGLLLCAIAQVMLAALQPTNPHYLLPSRATAGLLLWLMIERAPAARAWATEPRLRAVGAVTAVLLVVSVLPFWPRRHVHAAEIRREIETRYAHAATVLYRGASSVAYPLQRGNWEAGSPYTEALRARYPDVYFYHSSACCTFRRAPTGLFDWAGRRLELRELRTRYDTVIFVGVPLVDEEGTMSAVLPDDDYPPSNWGPLPAPLREVYRRGDEAIYEVVDE